MSGAATWWARVGGNWRFWASIPVILPLAILSGLLRLLENVCGAAHHAFDQLSERYERAIRPLTNPILAWAKQGWRK